MHSEFLAYARRCVPFYRELGADADFPLVGRAEHQAEGGRFRPEGAGEPEHRISSSGTTGQPLEVALDESAWYAVNHRFFAQIREIAGLPGELFSRGAPAVLFVSNKPGRPTFVRPLPALNDGLYLRLQLPDAGASVPAVLARFPAPVLYGKPTYLLDLRTELLRQGMARAPWRPRLLLTSGEPLHPDDRARLTGYFGAPLVDALASTEGGLIAATAPDERVYRVLGENVRLEVLDAAGRLAPSGAGELVLTNLVNRSTVFVRYRTGDFAELETAADGTQRLLRLRGREPETVPFRTGELPADEVTRAVGSVPGLADFRFELGGGRRTLLRWTAEPTGTAETTGTTGTTGTAETTGTTGTAGAGEPADPAAVAGLLREALARLLPDEDPELEQCERITPPGGKKRRFQLRPEPTGATQHT
ncbi:phenylacetate--CoA ligase family protein [Kitasatospora fiedleri]|uniref:hypothetical protein n=1 Tax=Kitasatospora fiedleri TaxID=2991545 RepID=UPI00249B17D3|nr:hypothetical protein [Kitasatospora fiedleri]